MNITKRVTVSAVALSFLAVVPVALAQGQPQAPAVHGQVSRDVLLHAFVGGSLFTPVKRDSVQQQKDRDCLTADTQGEALIKSGNMKAAIDSFLQALIFVPGDVLAYEHLAQAYTADGQTRQAITTYRTLLYHKPNMGTSADADSALLMRFALVLLMTNQREEALKVYQRGTRFLPADRGPLPPLFTSPDFSAADFTASAYTAMGLYTAAWGSGDGEADFERAIAIQPGLAVPYFYLGQIYKFRPGRAADALAAFDQAGRLGGPGMQPFVDKAMKDGTAEFKEAVRKADLAAQQ